MLVAEGEFAKHGVSSSSAKPLPLCRTEERFAQRRRSARRAAPLMSARVEADVVIDVPASSQVHRQVDAQGGRARARSNWIRSCGCTTSKCSEPDMHDPSGDLRRLDDALQREWRLTGLSSDLSVLQDLQPALRKGEWKVTVAVHAGKQIIGVWPGFHERGYGLAVDIGSTTIAAHLCNLESGEVVGLRRCHEPADPLR